MIIALYLVPMSACRRLFTDRENRPDRYTLSMKEKEILSAVQQHLFPEEGNGPGALQINALSHLSFVLEDKHLENYNRKFNNCLSSNHKQYL